MVKSGLVPDDQTAQSLIARGYLTDIDSTIFKKPIVSFLDGLISLEDKAMESRSAAKALIFSGTNTADSEYFSRELQLLVSTLCRLHEGDCGSTKYLLFR